MNIWHALVFGLVEGITEFLPVSSTGHLILTARVLGLTQSDFLTSFEIAIQLGAILAVVALYWRALVLDRVMIGRIAAAFLPTAVIGFVSYRIIKKYLLTSDTIVLWALLAGGLFLIGFELLYRNKEKAVEGCRQITVKQAVIIGLFQSIAMVPGVSRSAATIIGGLFLGISRKTIVEFSFLLAVPTMSAATALDLSRNMHGFSSAQTGFLLTGFTVSFFVAMASIRFLLKFIRNHSFMAFGVYRIAIALLFLL